MQGPRFCGDLIFLVYRLMSHSIVEQKQDQETKDFFLNY